MEGAGVAVSPLPPSPSVSIGSLYIDYVGQVNERCCLSFSDPDFDDGSSRDGRYEQFMLRGLDGVGCGKATGDGDIAPQMAGDKESSPAAQPMERENVVTGNEVCVDINNLDDWLTHPDAERQSAALMTDAAIEPQLQCLAAVNAGETVGKLMGDQDGKTEGIADNDANFGTVNGSNKNTSNDYDMLDFDMFVKTLNGDTEYETLNSEMFVTCDEQDTGLLDEIFRCLNDRMCEDNKEISITGQHVCLSDCVEPPWEMTENAGAVQQEELDVPLDMRAAITGKESREMYKEVEKTPVMCRTYLSQCSMDLNGQSSGFVNRSLSWDENLGGAPYIWQSGGNRDMVYLEEGKEIEKLDHTMDDVFELRDKELVKVLSDKHTVGFNHDVVDSKDSETVEIADVKHVISLDRHVVVSGSELESTLNEVLDIDVNRHDVVDLREVEHSSGIYECDTQKNAMFFVCDEQNTRVFSDDFRWLDDSADKCRTDSDMPWVQSQPDMDVSMSELDSECLFAAIDELMADIEVELTGDVLDASSWDRESLFAAVDELVAGYEGQETATYDVAVCIDEKGLGRIPPTLELEGSNADEVQVPQQELAACEECLGLKEGRMGADVGAQSCSLKHSLSGGHLSDLLVCSVNERAAGGVQRGCFTDVLGGSTTMRDSTPGEQRGSQSVPGSPRPQDDRTRQGLSTFFASSNPVLTWPRLGVG